jgi:hypothetical protein
MISRSGLKHQEQFGMDQDGLLAFRSWRDAGNHPILIS